MILESLEARRMWSIQLVGSPVSLVEPSHESGETISLARRPDGFSAVWKQTPYWGALHRNYSWPATPLDPTGEIVASGFGAGPFKIASDANGNYVIVWSETVVNQDLAIAASLFDASGTPLTSPFYVRTIPNGRDRFPDVAMAADGRFVVVWTDERLQALGGIFAQRYNADASPEGTPFRVSEATQQHGTENASVGIAADGSFGVTWGQRPHLGVPPPPEIRGRRFDWLANGGNEFVISADPAMLNVGASTSMMADGTMIVSWLRYSTISDLAILMRSYDGDGDPLTGPITVSMEVGGFYGSALDFNDQGEGVIAWSGVGTRGHSTPFARRMNRYGVPLGAEFRVVDSELDSWRASDVVIEHDRFVVGWNRAALQVFDNEGTFPPIQAQVTFDPQGPDISHHRLQIVLSKPIGYSYQAYDVNLVNLDTGQQLSGVSALATGVSADRKLINISPRTAGGTAGRTFADGNWRLRISRLDIGDSTGNPLSSDIEFDFFILAGDANRDRRVDLRDLMILANNWQGTGKTFSQGDFNYDGVVNSADLGILATRWQGTLSPPVAAEAVPTAAKRTPVRTPTRISTQILA